MVRSYQFVTYVIFFQYFLLNQTCFDTIENIIVLVKLFGYDVRFYVEQLIDKEHKPIS